MTKRRGIGYLYSVKAKGEKMSRTALYDYPMACIAEEAGIEIINVGDSMAMLVFGYENTLGARLDVMIEHAKAVRRGAPTAFIMGDMPFGSYQESEVQAIHNAIRYMQEASVDCVKIEGGDEIVPLISRLTGASIPVVAHGGLTPQSINLTGGYKTQGTDAVSAATLVDRALAFEKAGAIAVLLECIPMEVAKEIYARLTVPFFGTGVGPYSDAPMVNMYDLLGFGDRVPKFAKRYANVRSLAVEATRTFVAEVKGQLYPTPEHGYSMDESEYRALLGLLARKHEMEPPTSHCRRGPTSSC